MAIGLGAVVMFLAILLWSRTREASWMLVILSVLVWYVALMVRTLEGLGILGLVLDQPLWRLLLELAMDNLPPLLLGLGLFLAIRRARLPR